MVTHRHTPNLVSTVNCEFNSFLCLEILQHLLYIAITNSPKDKNHDHVLGPPSAQQRGRKKLYANVCTIYIPNTRGQLLSLRLITKVTECGPKGCPLQSIVNCHSVNMLSATGGAPKDLLLLSKEEKRKFLESFDFILADCDGEEREWEYQ